MPLRSCTFAMRVADAPPPPPSNASMERTPKTGDVKTEGGVKFVYREKREAFADCTWHCECCTAPCGVVWDTMVMMALEKNGTLLMTEAEREKFYAEHPEKKKPEGFGYWCLKCGFCKHCCCALLDHGNICKVCCVYLGCTPLGRYLGCVYLPNGRFCPGRKCPCLAGDAKPSKFPMDGVLLSKEIVGPGWTCTVRGLLDVDEEEEEEEKEEAPAPANA